MDKPKINFMKVKRDAWKEVERLCLSSTHIDHFIEYYVHYENEYMRLSNQETSYDYFFCYEVIEKLKGIIMVSLLREKGYYVDESENYPKWTKG